jgi:hypothetical protein
MVVQDNLIEIVEELLTLGSLHITQEIINKW